MRRTFICFLAFLATISMLTAQDDQVLFEVDGTPVYVSEFEYIYNKNNGDNADYSKVSLTEYSDLYQKFKLKVKRAQDMGLDTLKVLKKELEGYRKQLSKSYLVDREVSESLLMEVFDRQQKDIKVSHILFAVKPDAKEGLVAEAKMKATTAYNRIQKGESFENVAKELSDDKSSAISGGNLGFYNAMLPEGFYEFENALYSTPVGQIAEPVRSRVGYHILKVTDERPAYGEIEVAHLLLRKKKQGKMIRGVHEQVDSLYTLLTKGNKWEDLVLQYSDDRTTKDKAGYLGYFGINKYEKSFEKAAFELTEDEAYTKPVETKIGWHIIKRISKRDNSDLEKTRKRLSAKLSKTPRFEIAKQSLIENIKTGGGFTEYNDVYRDFLGRLDQNFYTYKWKPETFEEKTLFKFDNGIMATNKEFAEFSRKNSRKRLRFEKDLPIPKGVALLYTEFVNDYAIKYEESRLEEKYPEFKALMREYSEGILLFEATKINVWDKAANDTTGLKAFFQKHKHNYEWKERAVVDFYKVNSSDEKLLKKISKDIKKKKSHAEILDKYNKESVIISVITEKYERGAKELLNNEWKKKSISKPEIDKPSNRSNIRYIKEILPVKLKTLEESRGYVLADYQDHLEGLWVKELKESYKVIVNEDVFNSLIKN